MVGRIRYPVWFLVWDDLTEAKLEFVGKCQLQFYLVNC